MGLFHRIISAGLLCATLISATNLYVAMADGNLTTVSLSRTGTDGKIFLSAPFTSRECAASPSWLSLDEQNHVLYCLDRGSPKDGSVKGSLNSFAILPAGNLSLIQRVEAPLSGVHMDFLEFKDKKRGIVSVSYNKSAISLFGMTDDGKLEGPMQVIHPNITTPGPVIERQSLSYIHQVTQDPSGRYLFMNDLGGDMVRIFTWDPAKLGPLREHEPLKTDAGVAPRHGLFWKSPEKSWYYIFVGELSQKVHTYKLEYHKEGVPTWTKISDVWVLGKESPAGKAPPSEIQLSPDGKFIIVSSRENSFNKNHVASDSMSVFSIANDGTLHLIEVSLAGGWQPRQFSINKAGDMVAVGLSNNGTVAIWNRNNETGKLLGGQRGEPAALIKLSGPVVCTIWDEK